MSVRGAWLPLSFLLVGGGCVTKMVNPHRGWAKHESAHVTVYTDTRFEHQSAQERLEVAHTAYGSSFFRDLPKPKVDVVYMQIEPGLFGQWRSPLDNPPAAWTLENVPSKAGIGKDGVILLNATRHASSGVEDRIGALQMGFYFVSKALPKTPLWFQIGFARYLATYRVHVRNGEHIACYGADRGIFGGGPSRSIRVSDAQGSIVANRGPGEGAPLGTMSEGRKSDVLVPLDELVNGDWYAIEADGRQWHAFTAYVLVSYLVHGNRGEHLSRFPVLLNLLSKGVDFDDAFRDAYPHLLWDEVEDDMRELLASPPLMTTKVSTVVQGLCFKIGSVAHAMNPAKAAPVAEAHIQDFFDDIERLPLFNSHSSFYPEDIVDAEAAKRPSKRPARPGKAAPSTPPSDGEHELELRGGVNRMAPAGAPPAVAPPAGASPAGAPPAGASPAAPGEPETP